MLYFRLGGAGVAEKDGRSQQVVCYSAAKRQSGIGCGGGEGGAEHLELAHLLPCQVCPAER